jgi:hypothetical protein
MGSGPDRDERTFDDERKAAELAAAHDLLEELLAIPPSPKTRLAVFLLEEMLWRAEQMWESSQPSH